MTELKDTKQPSKGLNMLFFIVFCIFIALVLVSCYIARPTPGGKYGLVDSDCYMHLIRASDLYNHGQWYDPVWITSNAPFGEPLHWSRPFDVLLLAGAIPLSVFVDFETALFWWGVVLSPFLLVIALIALNWATRVILSKDGTFLVILLFLCQAMVSTYFDAGRPDHHGLLLLLFILHIGFVLRMIVRPFNKSLCYWAGAIGAVSIWISVESMVPVCVTMGVLSFLWILKEEDFLQKSVHYAIGLFAFCSLFLALERPLQDLALVKYDSISIVYVTILGLMSLFWSVALVLNKTALLKRPFGRFINGLLGICLIAISLYLLFPKLYQGPFADVDPRIMTLYFDITIEVQSFMDRSVSLGVSVQLIGSAIVSFAFLVYVLFWKKETVNRNAWIYMAISGILLLSMALYQLRWAIYPYVILSIVMTELLCRIRKDKTGPGVAWWQTIRNVTITLLLGLGFLCAGLLADNILKEPGTDKNLKTPSVARICEYLNGLQVTKAIIANPFEGAEILYRTDCQVVSTANTYGPGLLDTYDIMTAETDDAALEILQKRRTDMILLCPDSNESTIYSKAGQACTFYQRLCDGQTPGWLKKVELPGNLSEDFLVFEVIYTE